MFDVPLLIETGMHSLVDVVVLVYTPINIQKTRLKIEMASRIGRLENGFHLRWP